MGPAFDPSSATLPPASFTNLGNGLQTFSGITRSWLQAAPLSANRIALGAVLVLPAASKQLAYERLQGCLRNVTVDPVHSTDLFYQINWPRESRVVSGLKINRLTKWLPMIRRTVEFQLGSTSALQVPGTEEYYCILECDHSTAQERVEPFTTSECDALYQELTELVMDNAMNGEVPALGGQA